VRDAGGLLSGAGFRMQTVDIDDITVQYEDVADAITHLRVWDLCARMAAQVLARESAVVE
jgi:hypothetical protein